MGQNFAEGITVEKKADATYKVVGAGIVISPPVLIVVAAATGLGILIPCVCFLVLTSEYYCEAKSRHAFGTISIWYLFIT